MNVTDPTAGGKKRYQLLQAPKKNYCNGTGERTDAQMTRKRRLRQELKGED